MLMNMQLSTENIPAEQFDYKSKSATISDKDFVEEIIRSYAKRKATEEGFENFKIIIERIFNDPSSSTFDNSIPVVGNFLVVGDMPESSFTTFVP